MRGNRHVLLTLLGTVSLLAAAGCHSSGSSTTNTPNGNPNTGATQIRWQSVKVTHFSDMLIAGDCEYPWVLQVNADGSYSAGPCHGQIKRGFITGSEFTALSGRALTVALSLGVPDVCQAVMPFASDFGDLTLQSGGTTRYYELDVQKKILCYRGGQQNAQDLQDYMENVLIAKYYPNPVHGTPTPTAAPTATPTVAPSPTAQPSPTPSPSP